MEVRSLLRDSTRSRQTSAKVTRYFAATFYHPVYGFHVNHQLTGVMKIAEATRVFPIGHESVSVENPQGVTVLLERVFLEDVGIHL